MYTPLLKAIRSYCHYHVFTMFDHVVAEGFSRHIPGFRAEGGRGGEMEGNPAVKKS